MGHGSDISHCQVLKYAGDFQNTQGKYCYEIREKTATVVTYLDDSR